MLFECVAHACIRSIAMGFGMSDCQPICLGAGPRATCHRPQLSAPHQPWRRGRCSADTGRGAQAELLPEAYAQYSGGTRVRPSRVRPSQCRPWPARRLQMVGEASPAIRDRPHWHCVGAARIGADVIRACLRVLVSSSERLRGAEGSAILGRTSADSVNPELHARTFRTPEQARTAPVGSLLEAT